MRGVQLVLLSLLAASPTLATRPEPPTTSPKIQSHWECVPIARALSGIQIFGDARTWWGQADGHYRRGNTPRRGAVLAFKPHGSMQLGHVSAVSRVIDKRTILVTHSNWSIINGRRGQIERDVKVVDVSDDNDWSRVRVWFAPLGDLGTTHWPAHGFIYPNDPAPMTIPANARFANAPNRASAEATKKPDIAQAGKPDKKALKAEKRRAKEARKAAEASTKRRAKAEADDAEEGDKKTGKNKPKPTGRLKYLGKLLPTL